MQAIRRLARCIVDGVAREGTLEGSLFVSDGQRIELDRVRFAPPCLPTKIIGVGRNYAEHAAELHHDVPREPLLFFKPPSALNHHDGAVIYPKQSQRVDYEGELAVVIAMRCKNVSRQESGGVILGYTICNDITARDLQRSDGQWARAKGFDGFAPIGPCIAVGIDPGKLRVQTFLNGSLRQDAPTDSMLFDIGTLVEYASSAFTLEAGDVISTGTPAGIGPMQPGDVVEVRIDGIGVLRNRIIAAD